VDTAGDGAEAEWLARENPYDVMVLDVMLPGLDGIELCTRLRDSGNWTPVLMLTARTGSAEVARALNSGADDHLAKPFSYIVLLARLRALLRRGGSTRPPVLRAGGLELDPATHQVRRDATPVELTPRQFALLEYLMRRAGEVVPKRDILEHVWDFGYEGDPNIVEVYVGQLRRRIDQPFGTTSLQTVRLVGYRLADEPMRDEG
jgi:DNA-binding response OmpR family regulator